MKKGLLKSMLFLFCIIPTFHSHADVVLNETNFPNANFRAFVATETGVAENGTISDDIIEKQTSWNCNGRSIASLKGIEYFTALTTLDCSSNQLTALDLSNNTLITNIATSYNTRQVHVYQTSNILWTGSKYETVYSYTYDLDNEDAGNSIKLDGFDRTKASNPSDGSSFVTNNDGKHGFTFKDGTNSATYDYATGYTGTLESAKIFTPTLTFDYADVTTSAEEIEAENFSIYGVYGSIIVKSSIEVQVDVYTTAGIKVYGGKDSEITLPAGIYIVTSGAYCAKVVVK